MVSAVFWTLTNIVGPLPKRINLDPFNLSTRWAWLAQFFGPHQILVRFPGMNKNVEGKTHCLFLKLVVCVSWAWICSGPSSYPPDLDLT